jgi:hypothetical protein
MQIANLADAWQDFDVYTIKYYLSEAAGWFNADGMQQPSVTLASQNAPLAGATR